MLGRAHSCRPSTENAISIASRLYVRLLHRLLTELVRIHDDSVMKSLVLSIVTRG